MGTFIHDSSFLFFFPNLICFFQRNKQILLSIYLVIESCQFIRYNNGSNFWQYALPAPFPPGRHYEIIKSDPVGNPVRFFRAVSPVRLPLSGVLAADQIRFGYLDHACVRHHWVYDQRQHRKNLSAVAAQSPG